MSLDLTYEFPDIIGNYSNIERLQKDFTQFIQQYQEFKTSKAPMLDQTTNLKVSLINLRGYINFNANGQQKQLKIYMYIPYQYPSMQPKLMMAADSGMEIQPDGILIKPDGQMKDFPQWFESNTICDKIKMALSHFSIYPPIKPIDYTEKLKQFKSRCINTIENYLQCQKSDNKSMQQQQSELNQNIEDECLQNDEKQNQLMQSTEDQQKVQKIWISQCKNNMDQVRLKRIVILAKQRASNEVIVQLAEQDLDIKVVQDVIKKLDDVKDLDLLRVLQ